MFKTARIIVGAATLASAFFSGAGVVAHAGTFDTAACEAEIRADLISDYDSFQLAARALETNPGHLKKLIRSTCEEELAGQQAAAAERQSSGGVTQTVVVN